MKLKRNSTSAVDLQKNAERLAQAFKARGYPTRVVCDAKRRAYQRARDSLFLPKTATSDPRRIWWALDYTPRAAAIVRVIRRHWHLLCEVPSCEVPPKWGLGKLSH